MIQIASVAGGKRVTVWMEKSGELIAVGEVARGKAWLRASKRCNETPY